MIRIQEKTTRAAKLQFAAGICGCCSCMETPRPTTSRKHSEDLKVQAPRSPKSEADDLNLLRTRLANFEPTREKLMWLKICKARNLSSTTDKFVFVASAAGCFGVPLVFQSPEEKSWGTARKRPWTAWRSSQVGWRWRAAPTMMRQRSFLVLQYLS